MKTGIVAVGGALRQRQRELERRSMARDEATRRLADVRGLAAFLEAFHEKETRPGRSGRKKANRLFEWVGAIGAERLAAVTWQAVMSRLGRFRLEEPFDPYMTVARAVRAVMDAVRLELTAQAVEAAKKERKHRKRRGDARWTYSTAKRLGVRVETDANDAFKRAVFLVRELVAHSPLIEVRRRAIAKNKRPNCIVPTAKGREVLEAYWRDAWPKRGPMVVPPAPWGTGERGGYVEDMAGVFPLIRGHGRDPKRLPLVRAALDTLQDTPWSVNEAVYEYARPRFDPARKEHARGDRTLQIADELRGETFYFPHSCDWRGRIYPLPDFLSVNSDDLARGLLQFAEPKALGDEGARWLALHGANVFGASGTIEDRIGWVRKRSTEIEAAVGEPDNSPLLSEAKKPFQAYAFACEWAAYRDYERAGRGIEFPSSLPCEQDASCNVVQHIAALWRDAELGEAVNLLPLDEPQDIYEDIYVCLREWLRIAPRDPMREWWRFGNWWRLSRDVVKVPVMTLGYGVTFPTMRRQVVEAIEGAAKAHGIARPLGLSEFPLSNATPQDVFLTYTDEDMPDAFRATNWLTDVLWAKVLPEYAPGLVRARDYFRDVGAAIARTGSPVTWRVNATGFRVRQTGRKYWKATEHRVNAAQGGDLGAMKFYLPDRSRVDVGQQARALAANVVHSLDAAALVLTVIRLAEAGVTAVATVHDAFWVRAADGGRLAWAGRDGFRELHRGAVLDDLAQQFRIQADVPDPYEYLRPSDLDPDEVLRSPYFMS